MHLYRKFIIIYVGDRLIRQQTHSLYEKHDTQTFTVQQSFITSWYVGLILTTEKKVYSTFSHVSFHYVYFHSISETECKVTPTMTFL
jgi:hypothetical protein